MFYLIKCGLGYLTAYSAGGHTYEWGDIHDAVQFPHVEYARGLARSRWLGGSLPNVSVVAAKIVEVEIDEEDL